MKPFLLLQIRPTDDASDNEYEAFIKFGGLTPQETRRVRMERGGIPEIDLNDYSGVILGGGPANYSDAPENKSEIQRKYEQDLRALLDRIIDADFPYLGVCYGIGALAGHQGSTVSKEKFSEPVGAVTVTLTEAAESDPLTAGLPKNFRAFVGHKEACQNAPHNAILLASSDSCPVQMFRIKNNIYATQFHPELDIEGLVLRINIYKFAGYFPPEEAEPLIEAVRKETSVTVPAEILRRFAERYKRD